MNNTALPYPGLKATDPVEVPCSRCGGGQAATDWGYGLVTNVLAHDGKSTGRYCFKCCGKGTESRTVGSLRKAARAAARRAVKHNAEAAERAAREAEAAAAQAAHDAEVAAAREAERLAAEPVAVGRVTITGEIVSTRVQEGHYGYRPTVIHKCLVKDDRGFKVWGTMPSSIADDLYNRWYEAIKADGAYPGDFGRDYWLKDVKGQRVTFTATVTASDDDDRFGFFKRPTKAAIADAIVHDEDR